jgi:hypothetical protein
MNRYFHFFHSQDFRALLFVFAVSLSLRLMVHYTYDPWWSGDSGGYYHPAYLFAHRDMRAYDGGRTPGYPLLMYLAEYLSTGTFPTNALSPGAAKGLARFQSLLGILSSCLFYAVMRGLGFNLKTSAGVSILVALIPHLSILEMAMLPEAFSTFTLLTSLGLISASLTRANQEKPVYWFGIVTGLVCGLSVLVRPNNLAFYLILLCSLTIGTLFLPYYGKGRTRRPLLHLCFCGFLGLSIPVCSWIILNYMNTKAITLTPIASYARSFTAYNLFDRAPAKDRVLAEIMHKHYQDANQNGHVTRDYLWQALPDIYRHIDELPIRRDKYPHPTVGLGIYTGNVSQSLLSANPDAWLANGFENFKDSFIFSLPQSSVGNVTDPRSIMGGTVVKHPLALEWLSYICNMLAAPFVVYYLLTFLTLPIAVFVCSLSREREDKIIAVFFAALFMAVLASNLASCFLAAYYPRFSFPFYPLYLLMCAYVTKYVWVYLSKAWEWNAHERR